MANNPHKNNLRKARRWPTGSVIEVLAVHSSDRVVIKCTPLNMNGGKGRDA